MKEFENTIELARQQLPGAFTVGGGLPYSDGAPRAVVTERRGEASIVRYPVAINEATTPTGIEDIEDFEVGFEQLGFEAIAFYVSFHKPTVEGLWGIFYFDHRVRQFAEVVRRALQLQRDEAARLAFSIVRAHEEFHFCLDAYALYHELILQKPLYNEYSECVYRAVYGTSNCFEEALANRFCLESEHSRRFFGRGIYNTHQIKPFLKNLFAKAPPGYSDYGKPLNDLCSSLAGQLFEAKASGRLPQPQSNWIWRAKPFRRARCPQFWLLDKLDTAGKAPEFTFKRAGYKWRIHKNDQDHWPSDPHAHDYEENVKLDIRDGTIYDATTRNRVGRVKQAELVELRQEITRHFPEKPLEPLAA